MAALNHCGGAEKSQQCQKYFFLSTLNLFSKEVRIHHGGAEQRPWGRLFNHRGTKLVFCPGRHLTTLRPWSNLIAFGSLHFRNNWEWPLMAVCMWLICSNRKLYHKKTKKTNLQTFTPSFGSRRFFACDQRLPLRVFSTRSAFLVDLGV